MEFKDIDHFLVFSSLIGGATVAVLTLPKLVRKSLDVRRLNREIYQLKGKVLKLGKGDVGKPHIE